MRNRLIVAGMAAALGLSLAACGGDNGDDDATPAPDATTQEAEDTDGADGTDEADDTEDAGGGANADESLTIGIKFDQPGLGLRVGSEYEGFDVDVARYVVEYLGYSLDNVEFVESISANRETMLENGQVDMIFATYSITDARRERVDFAGPYYVAGQDLLVMADNEEITGPDALDGFTLCSVEGSTSAERIREEYSEGVQLFPAQTYSECVEFLSAGQVDAVTTDDIILAGFANQDAFAGQLKLVGNTFSEENYGIGLPKGSDMCEPINEAVLAMIEDGTWEELLTTHAGADYQYDTSMNPPEMQPCS